MCTFSIQTSYIHRNYIKTQKCRIYPVRELIKDITSLVRTEGEKSMKLAENKGKRSDPPERILLLSYTVSLKHHPLILNQADDDKIRSHWGFPDGTSGKKFTCQQRRCKRRGFDPWVGKIPWRTAWQPTPVFLPGESHGQRRLVGYSSWGRNRVRHN